MRLFFLFLLISSSALLAPLIPLKILGGLASIFGALFFIGRYRFWCLGALFFCINILYFQYRQPAKIIAKNCKTQAYLTDFPRPGNPVGTRFMIYLLDDCQLRKNIFVVDYSRFKYQLGTVYELEIEFKNSVGTIKNRTVLPQKAPFLLQIRAFLAQKIETLYRFDNQSWIKALLLGDRSSFYSQDVDIVKRNGTAHLIAISGFHLGIFAGISYALCLLLAVLGRFYLPCTPRTAALFGALILSALYSLITGSNPPIVRAWLMLAAFTLYWLFPVIQTGRQAFILAAIAQIYLFPQDLLSTSSWLSYAAVAVIMVTLPRIRNYSFTTQFIALQIFITSAMLPLTWSLFGGISLVAIPTNLILLPFTPFLIYIAFLALFLPFFATISDIFTAYYVAALRFWGKLPFAYMEFNFQPPVLTGLTLTALIILLLSKFENKKWLVRLLIIISTGALLKPIPEIIEVKQRFPLAMIQNEGKLYLINSGTRKSNLLRDDFRRYFLPVLRSKNASPEALILTTKAVAANTSISTVLRFYPNVKIYSFVKQNASFPFEYELITSPKKIGAFVITPKGIEKEKQKTPQKRSELK